MSRRQLLPSLLAISCLLSSGIQAKEKGSAAVSAASKQRSKSVSSKEITPTKKDDQVTKNQSKDDWFHKYQTPLSALGGFATGALTGTLGGYWYGGRDPKAKLEQAKQDNKNLQATITSLNSTIDSLKDDIAKYKADDSIQKLEKQIEDFDAKLKQKDDKIRELDTSVKQKDAEIKLQKDALESEQKKVEDLNKLLAGGDDAKQKLAEANNKINDQDKAILQLNQVINNLKTEKTKLETEKNSLKAECNTEKENIEKLKKENENIKSKLSQFTKTFGDLKPNSQDFVNLKDIYKAGKAVLDLRENKRANVLGVDLRFAAYNWWKRIKDLKFGTETTQQNFVENLAEKVCDIQATGMVPKGKKDIGTKIFGDLILFSIALESKLQDLGV